MRTCSLCMSPNLSHADELLRSGATQAHVARQVGLDAQVVGKHVRNGHVLPAPGRKVWEWSEDEVTAMARIDAESVDALAAMTKVPKSEIRRCMDEPREHGPCRACEAIDANEAVLEAIDDRVMSHLRPEPGHWVQAG